MKWKAVKSTSRPASTLTQTGRDCFLPADQTLRQLFIKFSKPSHPQALITPLSAYNPRRKINPTDPYTVCQSDTSPSSNHIEPSSHSVASKMTQNRSADPYTVCHSGTSGRRPSTCRSETPGETN